MRLRLPVVTAALLCGVAVVSGNAASAATGDASFALKPITYDPALTATKSYFILVARPGAVIKDRIRVVNTGGRTGTAYLYPVDATTGVTSGAVYLSRQSPRRDVGAWIRLARRTITLAPGADAVVPFTIRVPRSIRPGDHLGGIVAENAALTQSSGHGALRIRIKHLTIAAVEVQLPGRVMARADVSGVKPGGEHGYQYVYLHLLNPGTIMIKPAGSLVIRDSRGRRVARRSLLLDTFLPRTAIDYPALLPRQALSPGRYTATVNLHTVDQTVRGYRKTQGAPFDVTRTFSFVVSPTEQTKVYSGTAALVAPPTSATGSRSSKRGLVGWALAALAAVLGLGLALRLGRRRRARVRTRPPAAVLQAAAPAAPAPTHESEPEPEVESWAGLLLPYDSPRRETDHASVHEETAVAEPEPIVAAPEPVVPVAAAEAATPTSDELELERVQELIRQHDLASADAYFRPAQDDVIADVEPPPVDRALAPAPAEADLPGLGSALLGAVALAALGMIALRAYGRAD